MTVLSLVNPWNWVAYPLSGLSRLLGAGLRRIKPKSRTGRAIYYAIWAWVWFPGTNTATALYLAHQFGYEKEVEWLLGVMAGAFWWVVSIAEFWYHAIPKVVQFIEALS